MSLLEKKVVVITGSSSGIGRACAFEFAKQGATILLCHQGTKLTQHDAEEVQKELLLRYSTVSELYGADITDDGIPEQLIERTISAFGRIDILVNNAAVFRPLPAEQVTKPILQNHVDVNFVATYLITQAATRRMIEQAQGGSIVTISSNTTVVGASGLAHYAGSKAGALALMNNFAIEFGSHGIRYNSVLPGPTETQMVSDFLTDKSVNEALIAKSPMGRLAQPEEIASVVIFFASDLSRHVNGQQLLVDGGASYRFL